MSQEKTSTNGRRWLKKEMRPYRARILFLTVMTVLGTALSLAFAYMVKYLINSATAKNASGLWIFAGVLLGILLLRIALQTVSGFLSEKLRAKIVAELRTKTFSKLLRSDYGQLQGYHSGEWITRLTTDIYEVSVDTVGLLPAIVGMVVQCLGAVAALLTIDPLFTAIYVLCGGIFGGITAIFRKEIKKRQKETLQADGATRSFMQEGISSVLTLKAYGAEDKTTDKAKGLDEVYYQKRMKRNVVRSSMNAVFTLLSNFGLIFAVVWCSVSVLIGETTDYGSILSVILLLMQLQHPFSAFSSVIPAYYARLTSGERLQEIDALPSETVSVEKDKAKAAYETLRDISFEKVAFTYGRETVLTDANASVEKGEIVCVTGASGAGKSTLFKLLLHVFTPTEGGIYLRGETERVELTAKDRGLFAYVPQGKFLFSGTIYENLTFFAEETDRARLDEKVEKALKTACAEFVWELPQGLQTPLSEGGAGLSEGQMQRLAVARAILSDRPVLLLDEATSALDGETERKLLENIKNLRDKTCLIVTHRPAALDIADKILRVENGKITVDNA
ncbi:MAG: ABC transporter ATP-binding protein [Clostridia bacterium]|nr:ABC transporter ATP-binding protein [Clostridia bacterium]